MKSGGSAGAVSSGKTGNGPGKVPEYHPCSESVRSIASWIKQINPLYEDPFFPESHYNCGSCAFNLYKRLSGDSIAMATLDNIGTDEGMERATGKKCVYTSVKNIEQHLKSMGAGAHMIAGITRRLPDGTSITGHWFNIYYDGKTVYTLDGQSGSVYEWPHDYGYVSEWCMMK